jgi:manganese-dependent ADP-ribose/CDP-alcohol diphosphatase
MRNKKVKNKGIIIKIILITLLILSTNFKIYSKSSLEPDFCFGILADPQYCDCEPSGSRFYRSTLKKLEECIQELNTKDLSFVVQLGDLIDRDFRSFDTIISIYNQLDTKKYHVLGNHDFGVSSEKKDSILSKLGLTERYYDFCIKNWRFIVLDGNDISLFANIAGSDKYKKAENIYNELVKRNAPNANTWNGTLSKEQIDWMENKLKESTEAGERVILFCHYPVYPDYNAHNLWNSTELINLIESFDCIVAYINGHNHHGNYGIKKGIHYLTLHGMVETQLENSYVIVEVYNNYLKVVGYGREPNRILKF